MEQLNWFCCDNQEMLLIIFLNGKITFFNRNAVRIICFWSNCSNSRRFCIDDFGDDLVLDLELMLCERRRRGAVVAAAFGWTVWMIVKRSFNDILVEWILLTDCMLMCWFCIVADVPSPKIQIKLTSFSYSILEKK